MSFYLLEFLVSLSSLCLLKSFTYARDLVLVTPMGMEKGSFLSAVFFYTSENLVYFVLDLVEEGCC